LIEQTLNLSQSNILETKGKKDFWYNFYPKSSCTKK